MILFSVAGMIASCGDLLTEPAGGTLTDDQNREVIEQIPDRISAAVNGLYTIIGGTRMLSTSRHDDFGYPMFCFSSDANAADLVGLNNSYNWFTVSNSLEDRTYTYANPSQRWRYFYRQIKAANDLLLSIPEGTTDQNLLWVKGQALAVRAFDYFSLVQVYQFTYKGNEDKPAIPIVTEVGIDPSNNPRATVEDVYTLITDDINEAIDLLEGFQRPNKAAVDQKIAYGIRARINLVMNNWGEAASDAEKAMEGYTLLSKTDAGKPGFNSANAANWMWAIYLNPSLVENPLCSWPSWYSSFADNSYTCGTQCYAQINSILWNKIPVTDVRKGWWVDENLASPLTTNLRWPGNDYKSTPIADVSISEIKTPFLPYSNVKFGPYKDEIGNAENASDWCMMRAEEMLLIRAEAMAMDGDVGGAKTLLQDYINAYRDPSYVCSASTDAQMQNEVWFQRRVELWGEGFAFFDFMRLKRNVVRFTNTNESNHPQAFRFNIAANDGWLLLRLPKAEIDANNGIPESANNNDGSLPKSGAGAGLSDGGVLN